MSLRNHDMRVPENNVNNMLDILATQHLSHDQKKLKLKVLFTSQLFKACLYSVTTWFF